MALAARPHQLKLGIDIATTLLGSAKVYRTCRSCVVVPPQYTLLFESDQLHTSGVAIDPIPGSKPFQYHVAKSHNEKRELPRAVCQGQEPAKSRQRISLEATKRGLDSLFVTVIKIAPINPRSLSILSCNFVGKSVLPTPVPWLDLNQFGRVGSDFPKQALNQSFDFSLRSHIAPLGSPSMANE